MAKSSRGYGRGATGAASQLKFAPGHYPKIIHPTKPLKTAYCLDCRHSEAVHFPNRCAAGSSCKCPGFLQ